MNDEVMDEMVDDVWEAIAEIGDDTELLTLEESKDFYMRIMQKCANMVNALQEDIARGG
jgi:hypothetical protein